jgi:hypothetical protein
MKMQIEEVLLQPCFPLPVLHHIININKMKISIINKIQNRGGESINSFKNLGLTDVLASAI